ncbi:MAG TPA: hypothetical protein VIU34_09870 [Steroidobacter sp.]
MFKVSLSIVAALVGLSNTLAFAEGSVLAPPGVGVKITLEGPVFVDAKGMTLYSSPGPCTSSRETVVTTPVANDGDLGFPVTIALTHSCLQKRPPMHAPADAKPVGRWTIQERADGARQWAYAGQPLHTSVKDHEPGQINASYPLRFGRGRTVSVESAPLVGVPAGVMARDTAAGLTLTNHVGKTLYFADPKAEANCTGDCARTWIPFSAPALVNAATLSKQWSVSIRKDGQRQWAFEGKPLYIYAYDAAAHGEQFYGDTFGAQWGTPVAGWHVAVLKAAPGHPREVTVQTLAGNSEVQNFGLPKTVYADARGKTLYTVHCMYDDGLDCDDVGDGPRYWLSFCGGAVLCAKNWRTLPAPSGAKGDGELWSVLHVNSRNPFEPVDGGTSGVAVWAYRGRPVFTYVNDLRPGDYNGDDNGFGTTGAGLMQARPILAYTDSHVGKPVLVLTNE